MSGVQSRLTSFLGCCSSSQRSCSRLSGSSRMGILILQRQADREALEVAGRPRHHQLQRSCCTAACQGQPPLYINVLQGDMAFAIAASLQTLQSPVAHLPSSSSCPSMGWTIHHAAHLAMAEAVCVSAAHASPAQLIFPPAHSGRTMPAQPGKHACACIEPVARSALLSGIWWAAQYDPASTVWQK